jgi:phage baseplate assembly protein V
MNNKQLNELNDLKARVQRLESKSQHSVMQASQAEPALATLTATTRLSIAGNGLVSNVGIHQNYGFASIPLAGAMHTIVNFGGINGNGRSISTADERYRPIGLLAGDSAMHDQRGQLIWITNNTINIVGTGTINITAPTVNVYASTAANLTTALYTINGNVQVNGAIVSTGNMTAAGIDMDTHHHTGVQTGSGNTGGPVG